MVLLILNIQVCQIHKNRQHVYSSVIWEGVAISKLDYSGIVLTPQTS